MNSAVWNGLEAVLPDWLEPVYLDLPGHGTSAALAADKLDDYVSVLSKVISRPALWVGWSLGGLAVLKLARDYPERVAGMFMVACNPCFVCRDDWDCAVERSVFETFADALVLDQHATVRRFLTLQVQGDKQALRTVRTLQQALSQRGDATSQALMAGLRMLAECDLRADLRWLEAPVHWHLGGRDTLVPKSLAARLPALLPGVKISIEQQGAHAPFISHRANFVATLVAFATRLKRGSA
jgi:pimeloyl-[acyl-carrier protein] methyl ester esterase